MYMRKEKILNGLHKIDKRYNESISKNKYVKDSFIYLNRKIKCSEEKIVLILNVENNDKFVNALYKDINEERNMYIKQLKEKLNNNLDNIYGIYNLLIESIILKTVNNLNDDLSVKEFNELKMSELKEKIDVVKEYAEPFRCALKIARLSIPQEKEYIQGIKDKLDGMMIKKDTYEKEIVLLSKI